MKMMPVARIASALAALALCMASLAATESPSSKAGTPAPDAKGGFTVRVRMANPKNYKTLLVYSQGGRNTMNSSPTLENGAQVFKGSTDGVGRASLVVRNPDNGIRQGDGFVPGPGPISY